MTTSTTTPSTSQVSARAVEQALRQDIQTCEALNALLENELQLLNDRKTRDLSGIINQKQDLMNRLEHSARQRSQWTRYLTERTGLSAEQAWHKLLDELGNPALQPLWEDLQAKVVACRRANEVNGKIINRGQRTLKQLLGILRGQYIETPRLYNATGDTKGQNSSHTVIKV